MKNNPSDFGKIVFEDEEIIVVDKKTGVVVNKSRTTVEPTLQDSIVKYLGLEASDLGVGGRAGIVHRLDRETSGLILIAKTKRAFEFLQRQFKERRVSKEYAALVHGKVAKEAGTVDFAIGRIGKFGKFGVVEGGRESRTDFSLIHTYRISDRNFERLTEYESRNRKRYLKSHAVEYSLMTLIPKSGRTHQIRVHLKSIGHPVVSDLIYGPSKLLKFDLSWCSRLFLHAQSLSFLHPKTKKLVEFRSDLPKDLKDAILNLRLTPKAERLTQIN